MRSLLAGLIAFAAWNQGSVVYNGTTDYTEIRAAPELSVGADGLTIEVWMHPDAVTFPKTQGSVANQQYVHWLGKGSTAHGDEEWTFRMYSQTNPAGPRANRISFYVFNPNGGRGCGSYFQDPITPGQWIHIVAVVDAHAQTTAIYKNGVLRNTNSYAGTISPKPGSEPMRYGSKDFLSFFQGAIEPVHVWNRPLSTGEVSRLYASSAGAHSPISTSTASQSGGGC